MLRSIQSFLRRAYGDELPTPEEWAERHAKRCSADQLISAFIIQSIAKDVDDWESGSYGLTTGIAGAAKLFETYRDTFGRSADGVLRNRKKHMNVKSILVLWDRACGSTPSRHFMVNGVPFDDDEGRKIIEAYNKVALASRKAKEAADKALQEMKANETKWNLAEDLLGMKRNEFGALVPKEQPYENTA